MATTKPALYIVGAGGHAKVVADCAERLGYVDIKLLDDKHPELTECGRWPVVGDSSHIEAIAKGPAHFFVAIGTNATRQRVSEKIQSAGGQLVSLIHPTAVIGTDVTIGEGSLILANVVVNAFSSVGKGCILNTACSVDHDGVIANYVHIAPGSRLAGEVSVGERTFIGIGSAVIQQIQIGADVTVGAGSAVIHHIAASSVVVGSPARKK